MKTNFSNLAELTDYVFSENWYSSSMGDGITNTGGYYYPTTIEPYRELKSISDYENYYKILSDWFSTVKLDKNCVLNNYPPSNVITDKEKNLTIQIALAGYNKEEIDLEYDNDDESLVLTLKPKSRDNDEKVYLQKGIKIKETFNKYFVDKKNYDISNTTSSFKDGILEIFIPRKDEEKPIKLKIE